MCNLTSAAWPHNTQICVVLLQPPLVESRYNAMHNGFLLGFTHTPASYTSMASNIRNRPITPGLLYVLPIGVA